MTQAADRYRISPDNPKVIEQRLPSPVYQWGFFSIRDSATDAKRALKVLNGETVAQGQLWEVEEL